MADGGGQRSNAMMPNSDAMSRVMNAKPLQLQLLERQLKSADPEIRRQGVASIESLTVPSSAISESLVELLDDPNLYIKDVGVKAIGESAKLPNRVCVPACEMLGPKLKDKSAETSRQAAAALHLVTELVDNDGIVLEKQMSPRELDQARRKNIQVGPAYTAAAQIAGLLQDPNPLERRTAVKRLVEMGAPLAGAYCKTFAAMLADPQLTVRNAVIEALTVLGVEVGPGIDKASTALANSDPAIRRSAAKAMVGIATHSGPEAAQAVMPHLKSKEPAVRLISAEVMTSLGPLAAPHAGKVLKLLKDKEPRVRDAGVRALVAAGPKVAPVIKDLKRLLLLPDEPETRLAAELAMKGLSAQSGHFAAAAASILRDHENEDDGSVYQVYHRVHAMKVLAGAEVNVVPYLGDICNELDRSEWVLRRTAMDTLEELGPFGAKAAREVAKRLNSHDRDIRRAVAECLGRMGKHAGVYGQQLVGTLRLESDPHVVNACEGGIQRLKEAGVIAPEEE